MTNHTKTPLKGVFPKVAASAKSGNNAARQRKQKDKPAAKKKRHNPY